MTSVRANCNEGSRPPIEYIAEWRRVASYEEIVFDEVGSSLVRYDVKHAMLLCGGATHSLAADKIFDHLALVGDGERTPAHARSEFGATVVGSQGDLYSVG